MWVRLLVPQDVVTLPTSSIFHIGYLQEKCHYPAGQTIGMFIHLQDPTLTPQLGPLLVLEYESTITFQYQHKYYLITGGPLPYIDTLIDDVLHVEWDLDKDLVTQVLLGRCTVEIHDARTTEIKRPW